MRLTNAFFANHAEVVDDMLNVTGGCWTSTTVADGSTVFAKPPGHLLRGQPPGPWQAVRSAHRCRGPDRPAVDAGAIVLLHGAEPDRVHRDAGDRPAHRAQRR